MKTLYIPTTTLNFNNMMSSESISPKAYYSLRLFGYKNWHTINENPFENSLLLYEEFPEVNRPQSDYDDYSLVIAISLSEEQFTDMAFTGVPGVWQYDKTIYFNPANTSIFFDSEEHKRIALSKSESSAETKMVMLYQPKMSSVYTGKKYDISTCKDITLNKDGIIKDQHVNKMKGLLYGYYIGAAMSVGQNEVVKLNILEEIKNVLAAILASLDGKAASEQRMRLQELFNKLKHFDSKRVDIVNILESAAMSSDEKVDRLISLIQNPNYKNLCSNNLPYILNEIEQGKPEFGENKAIAWINREIEEHSAFSKSHKILLDPKAEEIHVSSLRLDVINTTVVKSGKPQELFKAVINDVLSSNKYNGKISTFKMDLATDITYKAKEVFAEEWNETCQAKIYLNALRKHIAGEPFNQHWNAGVLSSIAAVVLKGDDWEKLLDFLQNKGISNYRLAFAIYGELNGFANITRDFSDILLKENHEYVNEVYAEFHKQIHSENINVFEIAENKEALIPNIPFKEETKLNNQQSTTIELWQNEIRLFLTNLKNIRRKDKLLITLDEEFVANGNQMDYAKFFFALLNDCDEWKTSKGEPIKAWKKMVEHFCPEDYAKEFGGNTNYSKQQEKKQKSTPSFFDAPENVVVDTINNVKDAFSSHQNDVTRNFVNDDNAWSVINSIIPFNAQNYLKNDLHWFQTELRKPIQTRYKHYQEVDTKNNDWTINLFCKLKEKPNKDGVPQAPYFTPELRDRVRQLLKKYYCNGQNNNPK